MQLAYFLSFRLDSRPDARVSDADLAWFRGIVAAAPKLASARIYAPASASDPYLHDGMPPQLGAQLYFADIDHLEAALARNGALQALAAPGALPSLAGASVTQQAMLARSYPVPDPHLRNAPGEPYCTYLVSYEGAAQDLNLWLDHYIRNHPAIMARFPDIRGIEVCTRIDWTGFLPWQRVDTMLRNKVVFDSADALTAALHSPVRHEMRADYQSFPAFTGPVTHFPVATWDVAP